MAITANAAKILGVSDRLGTVETGKDADFALFSGNPLDVATTPDVVIIGGETAFKK